MKLNFKKISAIGASVLMTGMTMGVAAAANFPAPFVDSSGADVAVVHGSGAGVSSLDFAQTGLITSALSAAMPSSGGTPTGDSVMLSKSSDELNLGNTWSVFTGSVDDSDLAVLLADGTYVADDNDEFDYTQKINLGTPTMEHFRDSDYESLAGLDTRTPTIGFKLSSNTYVMNYTIDFTDIESDIVSTDLDDIEGSTMTLLGKDYYVSDFKNGTTASLGKLTLLDSATTGVVTEGEVKSITVGTTPYDVSIISFSDTDSVKLMVNGQTTNTLTNGESFKLSDGTYIGVKEATKLVVSGSVGTVEFSLGSGKLEATHGSDIKLNDETIQGVKAYLYKGAATATTTKLNKIVVEWKTDEEVFLTSETELLMPGFEAVKLTMNDLVRAEEEKVMIAPDGDRSIEMTLPIKDGDVSFNLLYSSATTGNFSGMGKDSDERLATSGNSSIQFFEKQAGADWHEYFVASYNISKESESYLLRAKVSEDSTNARNETTIDKNVDGAWVEVCKEKTAGETCDIGDVSLNIIAMEYTSGGNESVWITAGTNVNFNTIYTAGGLRIYLPWETDSGLTTNGAINFSNTNMTAMAAGATSKGTAVGHDVQKWWLYMDGEDKDDTIAGGTEFNLTLDDTSLKLHVSQVNAAGSGGAGALEVGTSTSVYEKYMVDDVAPRILHYTKPDEDYAEVYYPTGDSESYAEVFIAEAGSSSGLSELGNVVVLDNEVSSVSGKNLIVVGGSCINSVAATLLGGAACGESFTSKTGVSSGEYIIKSISDEYTTGKIALVVAGYNAEDTVAGVSYLLNQDVDTMTANLKGTDSTTATTIAL
jgi:hypothetical protein